MNLKCQETTALLEQRRDEELSEKNASQLEEHLAHCAGCRQEAQETAPVQLFSELVDQPLPAGVDQYILGGLRLEEGRKRPRRTLLPLLRLQPWPLMAATVMAAVLVMLWAFPGGQNPGTQQAGLEGWESLLLPYAMSDAVATVEDIRSPTAEVFAFSLAGETFPTEVILIVDRSIDL